MNCLVGDLGRPRREWLGREALVGEIGRIADGDTKPGLLAALERLLDGEGDGGI